MRKIIAIDPGSTQSAWIILRGLEKEGAGILPNEELLAALKEPVRMMGANGAMIQHVAIEFIQAMGMAVGKEVFQTCFWVGRFVEAWGGSHELVYRMEVKMHHCNSSRAKDANIRRALIDRFGEPGTKAAPNPMTYGIKSDIWSALAVGVLVQDRTPGATT